MATRIGRIEREFILKEVRREALPVELETLDGVLESRLLDFQDTAFRFSLPEGKSDLRPGNAVSARFGYREQSFAFTGTVLRVYKDSVEITSHDDWVIGLSRSFARRSPPEGLSVSFGVQGKRYQLDYPRLSTTVAAKPEEAEDIRDISAAVREWAEALRARSVVSLFRGREPSGVQETLAVRSGKAFYLPSPAMGIPAIDPSPSPDMGVITWQDLVEHFARTANGPEHAEFEAKKFLRDRLADGIESELVVPIRFQDYIVGVLSLHRRSSSGGPFDLEVVRRAFQFARVLAFSLEAAGYFRDGMTAGPKEFVATVVDISASGILISVDDPDLSDRLLPGSMVDVFITKGSRSLTAEARVARLSGKEGERYFAMEFERIAPEDMRFLYEHLYNRPFDDAAARSLL